MQINFLTHLLEESEFSFAIAAFSENGGHLTNEDGITQYSQKAIVKNTPKLTILEWLKDFRT